MQDALYELNWEVHQYYSDDEYNHLLGTIRDLFSGDDNTGASSSDIATTARKPGLRRVMGCKRSLSETRYQKPGFLKKPGFLVFVNHL